MTSEWKSMGNGWRISEPYSTQRDGKFMRQMVEECLAEGHPPPKVLPDLSKLTAEEKEEYLFKMQPKSTQDAILRQKQRKPEDDLEYLLRPIPESYLAKPDAKTREEMVGTRSLTPDEINSYGRMKSNRSRKGISKAGSVDDQKRETAIHAFTYSKPANPTVDDLKRLIDMAEAPEAVIPEDKEKPKEEKFGNSLTFRISSWLHKVTGIWWF